MFIRVYATKCAVRLIVSHYRFDLCCVLALPRGMRRFAVIDGKALINGSFNWTRQAVLQNQENVIIFDDDDMAVRVFTSEFERLWNEYGTANELPKKA